VAAPTARRRLTMTQDVIVVGVDEARQARAGDSSVAAPQV
jgi:hypothetical protein